MTFKAAASRTSVCYTFLRKEKGNKKMADNDETTGAGLIAKTGTKEAREKAAGAFNKPTALDTLIKNIVSGGSEKVDAAPTTPTAKPAPAQRQPPDFDTSVDTRTNTSRQNINRKTGGYAQ